MVLTSLAGSWSGIQMAPFGYHTHTEAYSGCGLKKISKIWRYRYVGKKDGLPSDLNNYVFEIGGRMLVAADQGVFGFNSATSILNLPLP